MKAWAGPTPAVSLQLNTHMQLTSTVVSSVSSELMINTTAVRESLTNHLTSGCLVTSGHCKPSAADEEWYSPKKAFQHSGSPM